MWKFIKQKPTLIYLALLTFAMSLCSSLQLSNLSSIFRFLGASADHLPLLWLAPPLTGLIVQPLMGQISDDTMTRFGKRRPYIIFWCFLAGLTFLVLPFISQLYVAIIITIVMNLSLNGGIETVRALTGDTFTQNVDRSKAFAIQALFAGLGGALGAGLPYIIHLFFNSLSPSIQIRVGDNFFPSSMKIAFFVSAIVIILVTTISIYLIKEKNYKYTLYKVNKRNRSSVNRVYKISKDMFYNVKKMPSRFKSLCIIHSLSWAGIYIFWLYFTMMIAQNLYGLPTHADANMPAAHLTIMQNATLDSSFYVSIYQYVSIVYTAILYYFAKSPKRNVYIHVASLLMGGGAMLLSPFAHTPVALEGTMIAYGITWGSIMVLPYSIALQYIPKGKLGVYLGIFNICITAPQIICSLLLSSIYYYVLKENASYLLSLGGAIILFSAYLWFTFINKTRVDSYKLSDVLSAT